MQLPNFCVVKGNLRKAFVECPASPSAVKICECDRSKVKERYLDTKSSLVLRIFYVKADLNHSGLKVRI